jgi:DNA-binding response OmpR family regulator
MSKRILLVEDDPHIRLGVAEALAGEGFEVIECADGANAVATARQLAPDAVILDIMLPHKSGYDICRELRAARLAVPILMLTAKGQELDKVIGLELGADDYVTKPFGLQELLARVRALLRRAAPAAGDPSVPDKIRIGSVEVRPAALRGSCAGHEFELTPREMAVLAVLYRDRGNAVSRDRLLNEVWGIEYYGTTRTLDQVIMKLRQKIEPHPSEPRHLLTVHGLGYRLEA